MPGSMADFSIDTASYICRYITKFDNIKSSPTSVDDFIDEFIIRRASRAVTFLETNGMERYVCKYLVKDRNEV